MATIPAGLLPIRDTLVNKYNVANERIGYDQTPEGNFVTIDNQRVFKDPLNVEGTTYAAPDVIGSRAGQINQLNTAYQLQQQLLNPQQTVNPMDERFNQLLDVISGRIQSPRPVDPYGTPQYAAAQAQVQQGAQTATRQAQEALGDSGFAQSTRLSDRAQRIQNEANQFLQTQLVPQIVSQLQAQEQQQLNNLLGLLGVLGQQQQLFDTRQQARLGQQMDVLDFLTGRQDRAEDIARADAMLAEEKAYRTARDSEEDRRWWADYERRGQEFAAQMGYNWASLNQRERENMADEAYRRDQLALQERELGIREQELARNREGDEAMRRFNQGMQVFQSTGQMPDYMGEFGIDVGAMNDQRLQADLTVMYDLLSSGQAKPKDLIKQIDDKVKIGAESREDGERLKQAIYMLYPELDPSKKKDKKKDFFNTDWLKRGIGIVPVGIGFLESWKATR